MQNKKASKHYTAFNNRTDNGTEQMQNTL